MVTSLKPLVLDWGCIYNRNVACKTFFSASPIMAYKTVSSMKKEKFYLYLKEYHRNVILTTPVLKDYYTSSLLEIVSHLES